MRETQKVDFTELQRRAVNCRRSRYRVKNRQGHFLHLNGLDFTDKEELAWRGNNLQFEAINKVHDGALTRQLLSNVDKATKWRTLYDRFD